MSTRARALSTIVLLLLSWSCTRAGGLETGRMRPRSDADRLNQIEMTESSANDALEAVQLLRPRWLQKRGHMSLGSSGGEIVVYVDNIRRGDPGVLRSVPSSAVQSMQYMDGPTATQRFGTNHVYGAILVQTINSR